MRYEVECGMSVGCLVSGDVTGIKGGCDWLYKLMTGVRIYI